MMELLEIPFTGPVLPATALVLVAVAWSLISLLGAVDADGWFGSHSAADVDGSLLDGGAVDGGIGHGTHLDRASIDHLDGHDVGGLGGVQALSKGAFSALSIAALRWLNLGGVPVTIWGALFAVAWWLVSGLLWIAVDQFIFAPNAIWSTLLAVKNMILAAGLTKLVTNPIKRNLTPKRVTVQSLIGKECEISSSIADAEFGLVKFKTGGAPLLLNVRTDGPELTQGTPVWITHYDKERRAYIVSPTSTRRTDPNAERLEGESQGADL